MNYDYYFSGGYPYPSQYTDSKELRNYSYLNDPNICGIINVGNNCYLNSGLQIIASCKELVKELNKNNKHGNFVNLLKSGINELLNNTIYDPTLFIKNFCTINSDFIKGAQCCSQNFIRTLIRNINCDYLSHRNNNFDLVTENEQYNPFRNNNIDNKEYSAYMKFINSNGIYPESKAQSIFSGITKSHSKGRCSYCQERIDNYSFSYFIDQSIYLDEISSRSNFSEVLKVNIGKENNLIMNCPKCEKEITNIKEKTKLIKLPKILIFTLERYLGQTNNVEVVPDKTLNMKNYIDDALKNEEAEYELFGINIRLGQTANFGHEICQVQRNGKWYEINDSYGKKIDNPSNYDSSYGLFYRKKTNILNEDESISKSKRLICSEKKEINCCSGLIYNDKNYITYESKTKNNIENIN